MLKNLNDVFSLAAMLIMLVFSLKFFFGLGFSNVHEEDTSSRLALLKDYLNNEDE